MNLELNFKKKNSVPLSGSSAQSTYCDALEVTLSRYFRLCTTLLQTLNPLTLNA